mmetsp:Transcript_54333/g.94829  ORF Transcript_54333/g.94829 Transcript_54333/m.94829 type:complete len:87 (+) Transcript_54333:74-334(+)
MKIVDTTCAMLAPFVMMGGVGYGVSNKIFVQLNTVLKHKLRKCATEGELSFCLAMTSGQAPRIKILSGKRKIEAFITWQYTHQLLH